MSKFEIMKLIPDLNLFIFTQSNEFPSMSGLCSSIKMYAEQSLNIKFYISISIKYNFSSRSDLYMVESDNGINFKINYECYKLYERLGPNTAFMVTTIFGTIFTVASKYHLDVRVIDKMSIFEPYIHRYCASDSCIEYSMISELTILYHVIVCVITSKLILTTSEQLTPEFMLASLGNQKILEIIVDICAKIYTKTPIRSDICSICNKQFEHKLRTCEKCKKYWYCSRACQKIHWNLIHKSECEADPKHIPQVHISSTYNGNQIPIIQIPFLPINKIYDNYAEIFRSLLDLFVRHMHAAHKTEYPEIVDEVAALD
jgi:hypothetical protein